MKIGEKTRKNFPESKLPIAMKIRPAIPKPTMTSLIYILKIRADKVHNFDNFDAFDRGLTTFTHII